MVSQIRRVTIDIEFDGVPILQPLSARCSFGFDQRVCEASFKTHYKGNWTYNNNVIISLGVSNVSVRFRGTVRGFNYTDNPRTVETLCKGYLTRAVEYENWEDPTTIGGLIPVDITNAGTHWTTTIPAGYTASAADIVKGVLDRAQVPEDRCGGSGRPSIQSTETQFGLFEENFVWNNGTNSQNFDLREQGETAMSYIERYDEVDAESNGRYRTFETLGGDIYRTLVGGRPNGDTLFTFTEGIDILGGNFTRNIDQLRNTFVVTGMDDGSGAGPVYYINNAGNPIQSGTHTMRLSSQMIDRSTDDASPGPPTAGDNIGFGMSCERVALALAHDFNREIVTGYIETFRDVDVGLAQTHMIDTISHQPAGLGVAEPLWVSGLEVSVDERGFTQRISYIGGGVDPSAPGPP